MSIKTVYYFAALTGGTATALDSVDGNSLLDGDVAFVMVNSAVYTFLLDADSGVPESSPATISPGTNAGTKRWIRQAVNNEINQVGTPGNVGFGVGICPEANLPTGMAPMDGYDQLGHANYGNYTFSDGSVMCWVPKFFYRIAHASNPTYATYGVNSVDIKGAHDFMGESAANAAGYALHRAFIDGGVEKPGFFVDKYKCSKNAWGTGYVASSIANALPLSSAAAHNPFADCTGGANYYYSAIDLAHRRDGVNGAVNASSIFFCSSQFIRGALAMLSLAHGQYSSSTTWCAWYHATYNFPKGCNNNALADVNDTSVVWITDGYSNCGKTGSAGSAGGAGNVFAKSAHNGQDCGVADLNGLMWEISLGVTCIATSKAITGASKTTPCVITSVAHGFSNGDIIQIESVVGMTELNGRLYTVANKAADTFELSGVDSRGYTAYSSAGTLTKGAWYAAKSSVAMKSFTQGNAGATDHWGATGVAAMMDAFTPPFRAAAGAVTGAFDERFGSGANQVLSESLSGAGRLLTSLGFPKDSNGIDPSGTNLFGTDYFLQYAVNELCLNAGAYWPDGTSAGVWSLSWSSTRDASGYNGGFRAAAYPV
jgi:hypothetical protein